MYTPVDKNTTTTATVQSVNPRSNAQAALKDNRPRSVVQQKSLVNVSLQQPGASVQRKISFAMSKQFRDIAHLKSSLKAIYAKDHHDAIDALVDHAQEEPGRAIGAVNVFNQIRAIATEQGWTPMLVAMPAAGHGPTLPVKDAHGVKENRKAAASAFMFGGITVLRAQLILPNNTIVQFETKQNSDQGLHAEEVLVAQIDQYLAEHEDIDAGTCKVRITINNAPCGTGEGEKNCAGMLQKYAEKFAAFHIYYMNTYGNTMANSVRGMQKAGIKVSAFSPKHLRLKKKDYKEKTWAKMQGHERIDPTGVKLDPMSGSESDEQEKSDDEKEKTPRGRKNSRKNRSRSRTPKKRGTSKGKIAEVKKDRSASPKRHDAPAGRDGAAAGYVALDGERLFEQLAGEMALHQRAMALDQRLVFRMDGHQVGRLIEIFGSNPVGQKVTYNDVVFTIAKFAGKLAETKYNPEGLSLALVYRPQGG